MTPRIVTVHKRAGFKDSDEPPSTQAPASFFNGAENTQINGGSFAITVVNKTWTINKAILCSFLLFLCGVLYWASSYLQEVHEEQRETMLSLMAPVMGATTGIKVPNILQESVAMNAVLNTGGRAEDAKCYNGTREEVIALIEQWIDSRDNAHPMLWLSGPAGGGKTAIMKTIAERSKHRDVHTANFFFFRGDPTRNSAKSLVATILYQIIRLYPAAHDAVTTILSNNPLILESSVEEQIDQLIAPLSKIIRQSSPEGTPIVLLLDGLDECDINAKHSQEQVLRTLHSVVTQKDSPFIVLVASRPESHIKMVFNQLGLPAPSIFLDEQFSPETDIRRFVIREFDRIKASHPNAHLLPDGWPLKSAVTAIVAKSSGQFIYAATAMRFLATSSAVPSLSLERVQGLAPVGKNSPFIHLDSIYTYIFDQADDHEATHDLISAQLYSDQHWQPDRLQAPFRVPNNEATRQLWRRARSEFGTLQIILEIINPRYTDAVFASCLSDLSAIVQLRDRRLLFYHASMTDFLLDPSRSNISHVDLDRFAEKIFPAIWKSDQMLFSFPAWNPFNIISQLRKTNPTITHALITVHPSWFDDYCLTAKKILEFLVEISRLYHPYDVKSYNHIVRAWTTWAVSHNLLSLNTLGLSWGYFYRVPWLKLYVFLAEMENRFTIICNSISRIYYQEL